MKKSGVIIVICFICLSISTAFVSKKAQSTGMVSQTGAPSEGTCAGCHGGGSGAASGITISAVPAFTSNSFIQGQTYTINVKVAGSAFTRFGFDCEILTVGSNANAGTMQNPSAGIQLLNGAFGRKNMTHTTPKTGTGNATFSFEWVAPESSTSVRIYVGAVCADLNGSTNGDFPMSTSLFLSTPTITSVGENTKPISALSIFPNPAKDNIHLNYQLHQSNHIKAQLIAITGQVVADLIDEKQDAGFYSKTLTIPPSVEAGVYFLKISENNKTLAQRLVSIN